MYMRCFTQHSSCSGCYLLHSYLNMLIGKCVCWTCRLQSHWGKEHGTFTIIQESFKKTRYRTL